MNRAARRLTLAMLVLALGACDAVFGIPPERFDDPTLSCSDTGCKCAAGRGDCDGNPSNGCEADLSGPSSCGGCGNQCFNGSCSAGVCACATGFADCDGLPKNGCEMDLNDPLNCGGCGNRCLNGFCSERACECAPGYLNCDGLDETGCEATIEDDKDNCGACGHSCLGGACENERCQPVQLFDGNAFELALVGDDIYFSSFFSIEKIPKSGATLSAEVCDGTGKQIARFKIWNGAVYWSHYIDGSIVSCPLAGGPLTQIANVAYNTFDFGFVYLAIGGGWVYWVSPDDGLLQRTTADGKGTPQAVPGNHLVDNGGFVGASETRVFWIEDQVIVALPHDLSSSKVELAKDDGFIVILGADATRIYETAFPFSQLNILPLDGGETTSLPGLFSSFGSMVASDTTHLYVANPSSGTLRRASLEPGAEKSVILALDQSFNGTQIVLDDKAIYWTSQSGIWRIAK